MNRAALCVPLLFLLACGGESGDPLPNPDGGVNTAPDSGVAPGDAGAEDSGPTDAGALSPGQVQTTAGVVEGTAEGALWVFRGIPYAAPPVGPLRFRPPEAHPGWSDVRAASAFGASCPQADTRGLVVGDEDCLTLNVWAPAAAAAPRPVMVWIHGGGFVQGGSSPLVYDGAHLAETGDLVVVSINYRLGVLGFLATPELRAESPDGLVSNYGILDQLAALTWVRDNVAAFGGDPGKVTIFGESAGGVSVCTLIGAPRGAGLFHRAVIESGSGCFSLGRLEGAGPTPSAMDIGAQLVSAAGCDAEADKLACMRAKDAAALIQAQGTISSSGLGLPDIGPAVDGVLIPAQPYVTVNQGGGNEVPVIIGSNADEAVIFTQGLPIPTRAAFEQRVTAAVGPARAPDVLALYPEADFPEPKAAFNVFFSDVAFNCPAESFARAAAGGAAPSYLYYFAHRLSGPAGANGVLHGHEIPFVFGNTDVAPAYTPTADDLAVSAAMVTAWTTFARDGAPALTPAWPPYSAGAEAIQVFEAPLRLAADVRGGRCEAYRQLGLLP